MTPETAAEKLHSLIIEAIEKDGTFTCDTDGSTIWVDINQTDTLSIAINHCVSKD